MKNPKLIITDYYDSLINYIDIHTEELLQKYSEPDLIKDDESYISQEPRIEGRIRLIMDEIKPLKPLKPFEDKYPPEDKYTYDSSSIKTLSDFTPGSTRVCDYLNGTRDVMIKFLLDAQKKTLEEVEFIRNDLKQLGKDDSKCMDEDDVMAKLFANRFHMIIKVDKENTENRLGYKKFFVFKLIIVDFDFYLKKQTQSYMR